MGHVQCGWERQKEINMKLMNNEKKIHSKKGKGEEKEKGNQSTQDYHTAGRH